MIQEKLSDLIQQASSNAIVQVPIGEHQGPFFIYQPLTLKGDGAKTVLWAYEMPAIIILSPGVVLDNLWIENTANHPFQSSPIISISSVPLLKNTNQQESVIMDFVIHLRGMALGQEIELPFLWESRWGWHNISSAASQTVGIVKGENRFHAHTSIIPLKIPQEEGIWVKTFELVDKQSRPQKQTLFYSELSNTTKSNAAALRLNYQKSSIYFYNHFELSSDTISEISGKQATSRAIYGLILPMGKGQYFLWNPMNSLNPNTTRLSIISNAKKEILPTWAGQAIHAEDSIQVNDLELKVQEASQPSLGFSHHSCEFQSISDVVELEISHQKKGFLSGAWKGTIQSLVPWIRIDNKAISIAKGGNTTVRLSVDSSKASQMNDGTYFEYSPLMLHDDKRTEFYFLSASLKLQMPQFLLKIPESRMVFDAATGNNCYFRELENKSMKLKVYNTGREPLTLKLERIEAWIKPDESKFVLPAQSSRDITVYFTSGSKELSKNAVYEKALILRCVETSEVIPIDVVLANIQAARQARLASKLVLKEELIFNRANPESLYALIKFQNQGNRKGFIELKSADKSFFMNLDPEQLALDENTRANVNITLPVQSLEKLSDGSRDISIQLWEGEDPSDLLLARQINIPIRVVNWYPKPRFLKEEDFLDTQIIEGKEIADSQAYTIGLVNQGEAALRNGLVETDVDWLTIQSEKRIQLAPDEGHNVTLVLNELVKRLPSGRHQATVRVVSKELKVFPEFVLRIEIAKAEARIVIHTDSLWFGAISNTNKSEGPTTELRIGNYGFEPAILELQLKVDWLSMPFGFPQKFELPPEQLLRLPISLVNPRQMEVEQLHYSPNALEVLSEGKSIAQLAARVVVMRPKAQIVLPKTIFSLGDVPVSQKGSTTILIPLENRGDAGWVLERVQVQANPDNISCAAIDKAVVVPPNSTVQVPVTLQWDVQMQEGDKNISLYLEGIGLKLPVTFKLSAKPLNIRISPSQITVSAMPGSSSDTRSSFELENQSPYHFTLTAEMIDLPPYLILQIQKDDKKIDFKSSYDVAPKEKVKFIVKVKPTTFVSGKVELKFNINKTVQSVQIKVIM